MCIRDSREAVAAGIGVIYQERQIMLELTVGENIFLGRLPTGFLGHIKMNEVHERAQKIIDEFGLDTVSYTHLDVYKRQVYTVPDDSR